MSASVCTTLTRRPRSRMAAVTALCFLLFALNIHAEELVTIKKETDSYTFHLPEQADFCLISRCVGEEKLVLRNTSDLWNSTAPAHLKQPLPVVSGENISAYTIHNLSRSDSGLYREQCWTEGSVTYDKNTTVIICSTAGETSFPYHSQGAAYLPCEGASDNVDVQWFKSDFRNKEDIWTRVFGDSMSSVVDTDRGRYHLLDNTSGLLIINFTATDSSVFTCLVMKQQQCVSSHPVKCDVNSVEFDPQPELIYRSVGETAVLPCSASDLTDEQPPRWKKTDRQTLSDTDIELQNQTSVDQNSSLVFSSLTLNHSGFYSCETFGRMKMYLLVVCPRFSPAAVELFSEGDDVTVRCRNLEKSAEHIWFIKSYQSEGRITLIMPNMSMGRLHVLHDGSLVISNVSVRDTGQYWCAVIDTDGQCVSTSRTVVKYRDPFGIHSTFYTVRCSVLSALLLLLCVAVVAVSRRSAHTHT